MTSETPGTGQPDPGEPPAPPDDAPTEAVPPAPAHVPPAPGPAAAPPEPAPAPPAAAPAPPPSTPAAPAPPQAAPAAPAAPPQWGAPPPQQPAPTWGPPPAGAPAPQQPAGWAPGAPAVAPGGGPPVDGTWNPQPATKSSNGCLKGCIIIAIILAILLAVLVGGAWLLLNQAARDLGVDPNSPTGLKPCELISGDEIDGVFGGSGAEVVPMGGIIDATIGAILDKRLLGDASDCWILTSGTETSVTGRIARQDSINASGDFQAAKAKATDGKFFGGDLSGVGDEAFCTGASEQSPSFGVLVRQGGSLVYVSLIDATFATQGDWETTADGVLISPETCNLAGQVAAAVLR